MSKPTTPAKNLPSASQEPSEGAVRDYAYHLYEQGGCTPGRDVDDWLEASACLKANIPVHHSHRRLHHHVNSAATTPRQPVRA
jgi:hypothetical protein